MQDFIQNKDHIISDYCDRFKTINWKLIWGIDLNCNSLSREEVWLNYKLLRYQELTTCPNCPVNCTFTNPSFTLTLSTGQNINSLFPPLN